MLNKNEIQLLRQAHNNVINHLTANDAGKVKQNLTLETIDKLLDFDLGDSSELEDIKIIIDNYLRSAVRTDSPNFYNQLYNKTFLPVLNHILKINEIILK